MSTEKASKPSSPARRALKRFAKNRLALFCLAVFLLILVVCLLAPLFTSENPAELNLGNTKQNPSLAHPMGTDILGRDILARMLYGGRTTFRICFVAMLLSSAFGLFFGLLSGFFGGTLDQMISRANDGLASIPTFLLAIFVEVVTGAGKGNYMYAIALALTPPLIRLTRNLVMSIMGSEYIEAARALGVKNSRIISGHVLRNIAGPVIVQIFSNFSEAILTCTIMGYLGLGVHSPRVEWGTIIKDGFGFILNAPLQIALPCLVVFICVLTLNIVGSGIRDALSEEEE